MSNKYKLKLYIAGRDSNAVKTISALEKLCLEFKDQFDLEILDITEVKGLAAEKGIIAVPTLIKESPPPPKYFIGDLSDTEELKLELLPNSLAEGK